MPSHTDDPRRTKPPVASGPISQSQLTASPGTQPARHPADDDLATQESFQAVLSSHQRAGRWEPADVIQVRAILGEVTLDFTRAVLPPGGVIDIEALAICGEVKIIVPDGAEVDLDATPIIGSVEQHLRKRGALEATRDWVKGDRDQEDSSERPYFRIDGRAILGSIKVTGR